MGLLARTEPGGGMTVTIVGAQLGDEGKGGVVDVFGEAADVVVRYQGGDNAGHTVVHDGAEFKLSLVPSGAVRGATNVLGNGCVVNLETLFEELEGLRDRGLDPTVLVAERAHVILPYHRVLDGLEESAKDDLKAGTTKRGIGPTYEDKAARRGVRVGDLRNPETLRRRLEYALERHRTISEHVYDTDPDAVEPEGAFDLETLYERCLEWGERLEKEGMFVSAGAFLSERIDNGDDVLLEGAQGTILDLDHGSYPYVTSSNPSAGGACVGTGLAPGLVGEGAVVGVVKAYLSRVGTGPLPTELGGVAGQTPGYEPEDSEPAEERLATAIREAGGEYGTVTGRPRRVGWLDLPMLRHAARTSGFTGIVVNHVDTLAALDTVKVAHAYECDGERLETLPGTTERWGRCEPVYREFEGWSDEDWSAIADEGYRALPEPARRYLGFLADELDVSIYAVGVGPERSDTVVRRDPFDDA